MQRVGDVQLGVGQANPSRDLAARATATQSADGSLDLPLVTLALADQRLVRAAEGLWVDGRRREASGHGVGQVDELGRTDRNRAAPALAVDLDDGEVRTTPIAAQGNVDCPTIQAGGDMCDT